MLTKGKYTLVIDEFSFKSLIKKMRYNKQILFANIQSVGEHFCSRIGKLRRKDENPERKWKVRQSIAQRFEAIAGPLPERRFPVHFELGLFKKIDNIEFYKLEYSVDYKSEVPAILLWPEETGELRACLSLHQTTEPESIGKKEPAGLEGRDDLKYGLELAQQGFVVLCPDYPLFGDYQIDITSIYNDLGYQSVTMKGIQNHIAGIDALEKVLNIELSNVLVIGHSLGGTNAIYLSCFEDRVGAIISSCGFTDWQSIAEHSATDDLQPSAIREKYMPLIQEAFAADFRQMPLDFGDMIGAFAPKPAFFNIPKYDDVHRNDGAMRALEVAKKYYAQCGGLDRLIWQTPDAGHEFPEHVREQAISFAKRVIPPITA